MQHRKRKPKSESDCGASLSAESAYSSTVRNREFSNHLYPFSPRQPAIVYVAEHLINQKHAKMTARDAREQAPTVVEVPIGVL